MDGPYLDRVVRQRNREMRDGARTVAKRRLMPYYLAQKRQRTPAWELWAVSAEEDRMLSELLQAKPRRTASGVTTVTVLTMPWPCAGRCVFCPSDIAMPKSYLSDEPACQRALRCRFDPYLQVANRLKVLDDMGHPTDKVELIVLGGSWTDYPAAYREWFAGSLFKALNEFGLPEGRAAEDDRWRAYASLEGPEWASARARDMPDVQADVVAGRLSYDEALRRHPEFYGPYVLAPDLLPVGAGIRELHEANESAAHRCVGLVMETRPDAVSPRALYELRELGCTKVQMGVQTLRPEVRAACGRPLDQDTLRRSFQLLRLFGFKIHAHVMPNLPSANPASDLRDFRLLAQSPDFEPDEVKIYPCVLVGSARLSECYDDGRWEPYDDDTLVDLLSELVLACPSFLRISRMVRDISACDIKAGSRTTNLRQMVEVRAARKAEERGARIREVRMREVASAAVDWEGLRFDDVSYPAGGCCEHFLQWVDGDGRLAGFLRLSLPLPETASRFGGDTPARPGQAMIRELHVYGRSTPLHGDATSAQHRGLGAQLVFRACQLAQEEGYGRVAVISAVGTRAYYRNLGFRDEDLYQVKELGLKAEGEVCEA